MGEESRCAENIGGMLPPELKCGDEITRKLKQEAVNAVNIYLIRLLELKQFCQAQAVGEALKKVV